MEIKIRKDFVTEVKSINLFFQIIRPYYVDMRILEMVLIWLVQDKDKGADTLNHPYFNQLQKMTYTQLKNEVQKYNTDIEIMSKLLRYSFYPFYLLFNDEKYLLIKNADSVHTMTNVNTDNPDEDYLELDIDARVISTVKDFKEYAEEYIQRCCYYKFTLDELKNSASYFCFRKTDVTYKQIEELSFEERLNLVLKKDRNLKNEVKKHGQGFLEKYLIYMSEYVATTHFIILPTVENQVHLLKTTRFSKKEYELTGGKIRDMGIHPIRFKTVA